MKSNRVLGFGEFVKTKMLNENSTYNNDVLDSLGMQETGMKHNADGTYDYTGDITISDMSDTNIGTTLKTLSNLNGYIFIENIDFLDYIVFENLKEVTGSIDITDCKDLKDIQFPRLKKCQGYMNIEGCKVLEVLHIPNMEYVQSLFINECPKLEHLDISSLKNIGADFEISHTRNLTSNTFKLNRRLNVGGSVDITTYDMVLKRHIKGIVVEAE